MKRREKSVELIRKSRAIEGRIDGQDAHRAFRCRRCRVGETCCNSVEPGRWDELEP
jgi:hypothetical protein